MFNYVSYVQLCLVYICTAVISALVHYSLGAGQSKGCQNMHNVAICRS